MFHTGYLGAKKDQKITKIQQNVGVTQHSKARPTYLRKRQAFDSWFNFDNRDAHNFTIQQTRRDLVLNKGSLNFNHSYAESDLHRPNSITRPLEPLWHFGDQLDDLNRQYDARGQLVKATLSEPEECKLDIENRPENPKECKEYSQRIFWDTEGNKESESVNIAIGNFTENLSIGKNKAISLDHKNNPRQLYQSENSRLYKSEKLEVKQRSWENFDKFSPPDGSNMTANKKLDNQLSDEQARIYPDKTANFGTDHRFHTRDIYLGDNRIASYTIDTLLNDGGKLKNAKPIVRYYHANHVGSVELETDERNRFARYATYDPYGLPVFDSYRPADTENNIEFNPPRYGFVGKELDVSGYYYFGARYFNPRTVLWLSGDPILLSGTAYANLHNLNSYFYTSYNPIVYFDSEGLSMTHADARERYQFERGGIDVAVEKFSSKFAHELSGGILGSQGNNANRYIYTDKSGWIDLRHVGAAKLTSDATTILTDSKLLGAFSTYELGVGMEIAQGVLSYDSSFRKEDLLSNDIGLISSTLNTPASGLIEKLGPMSLPRTKINESKFQDNEKISIQRSLTPFPGQFYVEELLK